MIDVSRINTTYKQTGNVCVLASYSIVIEYFSKGKLDLSAIFTKFITLFEGLNSTIGRHLVKAKPEERRRLRENLISEKFHEHCRTNGDIRGFNYFVELHNSDVLNSNGFGTIIRSNAFKDSFIPVAERNELRDALIDENRLAMVLYPVSANALHAVVVGFDSTSKSFFKRDPQIGEIQYADVLLMSEITEYILFEGTEKS